jgi:hypothetical protein
MNTRAMNGLLVGACLLAASLGGGCAINRNVSVSRTYTVSDASSMQKTKKVQYSRVAPGFSFADYAWVYIPEVRLEGPAADSPLGPGLAQELRLRVVRELSKKYPVGKEPEGRGGQGKRGRLELAITDIESGNGFVRWFIATSIAPTLLQVEGRVVEEGKDQPEVEFVRRRSYDGHPWGGLNFTLFSDMETHRSSIKEIARDIASFLGRAGKS